MSLIKAFLVLLLLSAPASAFAQFEVVFAKPINVQSLSGKVQDPTHAVIAGAHVEISDTNNNLLSLIDTDNGGNFHFNNFSKTEYKLKITMPGFNTVRVIITIKKHSHKLAIVTMPIAA